MNREYEPIPVLIKDNGETINVSEVNNLAIEAYKKINNLTSFNCGTISTGKYVDWNQNSNLFYPTLYVNHCGRHMHRVTPIAGKLNTVPEFSIDLLITKITDRINNLLNKV